MAKRKKMIEFRLDWISAVDRPAQEPATVAILKRREGSMPKTETQVDYIKRLLDEGKIDPKAKDAEVKKATALTTEMDGHTHLIHTGRFDGSDEKAGSTSWTDEHSHPWIRDNDGDIVIGAADGHTHDVAIMTKKDPAEEAPMPEKKPDDAAKSAEAIADLTKRLERSEKVVALNDTEKAFFSTLTDATAQDAFLAKSAEDRSADIAAAKADDPIVYKGADGAIFRKSDDARLVQMAKDRDADRTALATERMQRRDAEYAKQAQDLFKHLPGESKTHIALLKSVAEITNDDTRAAAMDVLKAADNGLSEAFETRGVRAPSDGSATPEQELDKMARDRVATIAKGGGKETFEAAYVAVLETPEGQALYAKVTGDA